MDVAEIAAPGAARLAGAGGSLARSGIVRRSPARAKRRRIRPVTVSS